MARPEFAPLDTFTPRVRDAFVPLLSVLSSSFAKLTLDDQIAAIETNVPAVLNNPNATLLVHHDSDSDTYASTLTVNKVVVDSKGNVEGWVDDVSTLLAFQGKGLGRAGMTAGHEELRREGVRLVRLTSKPERAFAGNLYDKMGYIRGGAVFRAAIDSVIGVDFGPSANGLFVPVDCTIPSGNGHKAWIYGPQGHASIDDQVEGLATAHSALRAYGATSANYFTTEESLELGLVYALTDAGYAQRDTRLFTLDLEQVAA